MRGLWLLILMAAGCRSEPSPPGTRVEIVAAPEGPVANLVLGELTRAEGDGRDLVVYVGATWCEPCQYFHDAAVAGKLDARFPKLRILEFDHDRDEPRLLLAGCASRMLPLFAIPQKDGRCSEAKRFAGSIKGPGAVDDIAPKLENLLGSR